MDADFLAIKSLFEAGNVKTMRLLEEQAPTKMAKTLGLNYNSYLEKLRSPEKFAVRHIFIMAKICGLDPNVIFDIIKKEYKA
jgi:hypothetical protein